VRYIIQQTEQTKRNKKMHENENITASGKSPYHAPESNIYGFSSFLNPLQELFFRFIF
jgi:hypothetical protein